MRRHRHAAPGARATSATLALGALLLLGACAPFPAPPEEVRVVQSPLQQALRLIDLEAFTDAEAALRRLASVCEAGPDGRRAVLLLAALRIDPRNEDANPDSTALLAARYLALPDADPAERPLAESLYAVALDLGADPTLRPAPAPVGNGLADRFTDCEAPPRAAVPAPPPLPRLEREPVVVRLQRAERERDSLTVRVSQLTESSRTLERRIQELETELQRIRRLLGAPPANPGEAEPVRR